MPIGASAGTLDIENATLRSNAIAVLTNLVAGNDQVRQSGPPALEVYGDPSHGGNEPRLELVSNIADTASNSFTRLTSNAGVFSIETGTSGTSDNGTITFGGFQNERLRITSDGNVGIGTDNPLEKLDVRGAIIAPVVAYNFNEDAPYLIAGTPGYTGAATNWNTYGFQHRIKSNSGGGPRITVDSFNGELFTIDNNGNVGIGKTDPGERLFVNGNIALNWSDDRRIIMNFDDDYRQGIEFDASTRGMTLFSTTNDAGGTIIFKTRGGSGSSDTDYGTERMRIRSDGNVGIGTTDPKAPLHVNQNKAIINGQMSLQTLNVYKNAGGNSGSQTKRYYRVYVPNSYANFQIILQGFARNYTGSGDIQAWRRQYTVQRNSGAVVGISHDSGENINATGFTFATSTVGSATSVIEVHFDVTFPPKPEAATYISFTAQLMGDTGYFAENTSS